MASYKFQVTSTEQMLRLMEIFATAAQTPSGSQLVFGFNGPPGVGKTTCSNALARFLTGQTAEDVKGHQIGKSLRGLSVARSDKGKPLAVRFDDAGISYLSDYPSSTRAYAERIRRELESAGLKGLYDTLSAPAGNFGGAQYVLIEHPHQDKRTCNIGIAVDFSEGLKEAYAVQHEAFSAGFAIGRHNEDLAADIAKSLGIKAVGFDMGDPIRMIGNLATADDGGEALNAFVAEVEATRGTAVAKRAALIAKVNELKGRYAELLAAHQDSRQVTISVSEELASSERFKTFLDTATREGLRLQEP